LVVLGIIGSDTVYSFIIPATMRYLGYFFLLLFTGISLLSCQKEEISLETSDSLVGNWQWVSSNGGITGQDRQTPAGTKIEVTIQFTSDNRFIRYENGI